MANDLPSDHNQWNPIDEYTFLPWKLRLIKVVIGLIAFVVVGFLVVSNWRATLSPSGRYQILSKNATIRLVE